VPSLVGISGVPCYQFVDAFAASGMLDREDGEFVTMAERTSRLGS
jgi:hypothetical protein